MGRLRPLSKIHYRQRAGVETDKSRWYLTLKMPSPFTSDESIRLVLNVVGMAVHLRFDSDIGQFQAMKVGKEDLAMHFIAQIQDASPHFPFDRITAIYQLRAPRRYSSDRSLAVLRAHLLAAR